MKKIKILRASIYEYASYLLYLHESPICMNMHPICYNYLVQSFTHSRVKNMGIKFKGYDTLFCEIP